LVERVIESVHHAVVPLWQPLSIASWRATRTASSTSSIERWHLLGGNTEQRQRPVEIGVSDGDRYPDTVSVLDPLAIGDTPERAYYP
jgi:hypothetical protein